MMLRSGDICTPVPGLLAQYAREYEAKDDTAKSVCA
jgi:hypothetical protein